MPSKVFDVVVGELVAFLGIFICLAVAVKCEYHAPSPHPAV